jgi:hypothetical protein
MRIVDVLWLPDIVDKLASKHDVELSEVEQVLARQPRFRRLQRGKVRGEDLYAAIGQTESGRYLIVFFIRKMSGSALVVSARDLDPGERRQYERK